MPRHLTPGELAKERAANSGIWKIAKEAAGAWVVIKDRGWHEIDSARFHFYKFLSAEKTQLAAESIARANEDEQGPTIYFQAPEDAESASEELGKAIHEAVFVKGDDSGVGGARVVQYFDQKRGIAYNAPKGT